MWIRDSRYTIGQETANTGETVQEWLARMIEGLPGIHETGISVTAADITLTDFQPAVEGSAITPAGTNGSFRFKVSFTKGSQSLVSGERSGIITARAYAVQNDQQAVDVAKAVIENSASAYMVRQATANTLSEVQAWLVETVNALPGIKAAGITVGAGDISMEQQSFQPAEAGNAATSTGTDGGFRFTVSLSKGGASVETNMTSGIITCLLYTSVLIFGDMFPNTMQKWFRIFLTVSSGLFIGCHFVLDSMTISRFLIYYQAVMGLTILYVLVLSLIHI